MIQRVRGALMRNRIRVLALAGILAVVSGVWRYGATTLIEQLGAASLVIMLAAAVVVKVVVDRPALEQLLHYLLLAGIGFVAGVLVKPRVVDALGGGA